MTHASARQQATLLKACQPGCAFLCPHLNHIFLSPPWRTTSSLKLSNHEPTSPFLVSLWLAAPSARRPTIPQRA